MRNDSHFERFGIDYKQIERYDILCLPENFEDAESAEQLYDTVESIDLCKLLKSQGLNCANSLDLGIDIGYRDRRSADLWLGTLWVQGAVSIVCTAIGTAIGTLIGMKLAQKQQASPPSQINQTIHINLNLPEGDSRREIKFDEQEDPFLKQLAEIAGEGESEQKIDESQQT